MWHCVKEIWKPGLQLRLQPRTFRSWSVNTNAVAKYGSKNKGFEVPKHRFRLRAVWLGESCLRPPNLVLLTFELRIMKLTHLPHSVEVITCKTTLERPLHILICKYSLHCYSKPNLTTKENPQWEMWKAAKAPTETTFLAIHNCPLSIMMALFPWYNLKWNSWKLAGKVGKPLGDQSGLLLDTVL